MKIGVVGIGIVGSAVSNGFKSIGHDIYEHDIRYNTSLEDMVKKNTEVCFICVPTPSTESGECDTRIVEEIVGSLSSMNYSGIVAIKSTVMPGTTNRLSEKFDNLKICFVPEFLRERCALEDFIDNHDLCVVGTEDNEVYQTIMKCHKQLPDKYIKLSPVEAEVIKYFNNVYNATLITFANAFYRLCQDIGADYDMVKNTIVTRKHISDAYLDCSENFRGFGGPCLPKDTRAMAWFANNRNLDIGLFDMLLKENSKYKTTVYDGMRDE